MTVRLYHSTNHAAADLIDQHGFLDGHGNYGLVGLTLTDVFVSDRPLDPNEGAGDEALYSFDVDDLEAIADYELSEEGKPYREWCVPAEVLTAGLAGVSRSGERQWITVLQA